MITEIRHGRYFENARKFYCGAIPAVELRGSWFQMGRQYGALLRDELAEVLRFAQRNPEGFNRVGQLGKNTITGRKRYDELYRGMAETSGLTLEQLRIVNSVELIYLDRMAGDLRRTFDGGRCSSLAVWGEHTPDGRVLFARNYDWLPDFGELLDTLVLAVFHPADGANAVVMINWAGCLYLTTGMNESGLFLELNSGAFADTGIVPERIHTTWLLWEFLLDSNDFSALRSCFATCRSAAAYLIGTADADRAEVFEWPTQEPAKTAPHEAGILAAANHFNSPGWINTALAGSCGDASSINRRANLLKCAGNELAKNRKIGPAELAAIMDRTVAEGGAKVAGTLFQVIAAPAAQTWYIKRRNDPDWTEIELTNLLKGNGELA
ncbi:MAG: hypothetical protein J5806_14390 [Lentisphaeria bacterium]|nr:hypothetical protein [Lentisphaeria bacterium]